MVDWLNGWLEVWVFVYELSGCGFKSRCCHPTISGNFNVAHVDRVFIYEIFKTINLGIVSASVESAANTVFYDVHNVYSFTPNFEQNLFIRFVRPRHIKSPIKHPSLDKKWSFPLRIYSVNVSVNLQFPGYLVPSTEFIFNGKLQLLCSV